jgi:RHS repeat-associated protein
MRTSYRKHFSTFILFITTLTVNLFAQEPVELVKMRQPNRQIFLNPDSSFTARLYASPVYFQDTTGAYQPIEPQLVASARPGYNWEVTRGLYRVYFKDDPTDSKSVLVRHRSGHWLAFRLAGVGYYETSTGNRHLFNSLQSGQSQVVDNRIIYRDVLPGLEMQLSYLNSRLKEELIIRDQARGRLPDPNQFGFNADSTYIAFVMELDMDHRLKTFVRDSVEMLAGNFQGFSRIAFKDVSKRARFFLPLDYAYLQEAGVDSGMGTGYLKKLKRRIINVNGKLYIISGVPYRWLQHIPDGDVIIDPTIEVTDNASADTWLEDAYPKSGYNLLCIAKAKCYPKKRIVIGFDVSDIPQSAVISSATLNMNYYSRNRGCTGSWVNRPIGVYRLTRQWIETQATRDNARSGVEWTNDYAEGDYTSWSDYCLVDLSYGWKDWDVTSIVRDWVDGSEPNYGFLLKAENEDIDGYDIRFHSREYSSNQPYLEVTYTLTMKKYYYIKDHLGSIRSVIDEAGIVKESYDYYPFGLKMPGHSYVSGTPSRNLFTGKERDDETGWDYFGARYYDARIGRFISTDPLESSSSPYTYCSNNPMRFIDPNGEFQISSESAEEYSQFLLMLFSYAQNMAYGNNIGNRNVLYAFRYLNNNDERNFGGRPIELSEFIPMGKGPEVVVGQTGSAGSYKWVQGFEGTKNKIYINRELVDGYLKAKEGSWEREYYLLAIIRVLFHETGHWATFELQGINEIEMREKYLWYEAGKDIEWSIFGNQTPIDLYPSKTEYGILKMMNVYVKPEDAAAACQYYYDKGYRVFLNGSPWNP